MFKKQLFRSSLYIALMIIISLAIFFFWSCSKNDKNPIKSETTTGTVTDIDGNSYKTIKIGNQWWMAENLKVTHFNNGDSIPNIVDPILWSMTSRVGVYCNYWNSLDNVDTYGLLYNWSAVNDSRGIGPSGWHVPSDAEWKVLEIYVGLSQSETDIVGYRGSNEGRKLKEKGYKFWCFFLDTTSTNESGFSALPGGYRDGNGKFHNMGTVGYFWSSSKSDTACAWYRMLSCMDGRIYRDCSYRDYQEGFSIRCVRN
jgi:uncharacterized protein (TIGR02145 family)